MRMNIISALSLLAFGTLSLAEEVCWSLAEGYPCCQKETTKVAYITEKRGAKFGVENGDWCGITELQENYIAAHPTTETATKTKTVQATSMDSSNGCWSLVEDIPCCVDEKTKVSYVSDARGVKYGVENKEWCGITDLQINYQKYLDSLNCWSLEEGYPCCEKETTIIAYITEGRGAKFGVENGDWCGITELQENYMAVKAGEAEKAKCAAALEMCGGSLFPDAPTCCEAGSFCWHYSDEWHECMPNEFKPAIQDKYRNL